MFNIEIGNEEFKSIRLKKRMFTSKEKIVLYGLVRHPEMNDTKLAKAISVSRQTISSLKKRLIEEGIIKTTNIPEIGRLGYELLVFSRAKISRAYDKDKILAGLLNMSKHAPIHLMLMSENDSICMFIPVMGLIPRSLLR